MIRNSLFLVAMALLFGACNSNNSESTKKSEVVGSAFDSLNNTNDFYDDAPTFDLGKLNIKIDGDIETPTNIDGKNLPLRSVIVKETLLHHDSSKFIGAYRYDGYSLYDILNSLRIDKKTKNFNPIIDLFVIVSNDAGDSVILSWGEIFYPVHRHEIIIATQVMRIVPSKTKDLWELPKEVKLIVASDLLTERNIASPSKITVCAAPIPADESKKGSALFSENINIYKFDEKIELITNLPSEGSFQDYPSVFYGRGRGIHGVRTFHGVELDKYLSKYFPITVENIKKSYIVVKGSDDYHGVYTYSEIFNRNDQASFLLTLRDEGQPGYKFALYPTPDFFSDRAIKSITEIRYLKIK